MTSIGLGRALADLFVTTGERDAAAVTDVDGMRPDDRGGWLVRRPSIPPLFFVACGLWLGCAACIDIQFGRGPQTWIAGCGVGLAIGVFASMLFWHGRACGACFALGIALGCIVGSAHVHALLGQTAMVFHESGLHVVEVVRDSRQGEFGASVLAKTRYGALVRVSIPDGDVLLVGDVVECQAKWQEPSAKNQLSSWRDGIVATARVRTYAVRPGGGPLSALRGFRREAIQAVSACAERCGSEWGVDLDDASMIMQAVVLGHVDSLYASSLYQEVKVDGLAHLVAVSGAHLVIVCGMVATMFRRICIPRFASIIVQIAFIMGYLVLTGAPVSAIRASIMASLGMLAYMPGRRPYALGALSFCVIAMIGLAPSAVFSMSFALSATSTLGVVAFMPFFEAFFRRMGVPGNALSDSCALTMAATMVTAPLSACRFGQFSLIAPLANAVAAPAFPILCLGGLCAIAIDVVSGGIFECLLGMLLVFAAGFAMVLGVLSHIPFASVPVSLDAVSASLLVVGVPVGMWLIWPRPTRALGVCLAFCAVLSVSFSVAAPLLRGDAITMLDIGQGDAILVQSAGRSLLIDTGTQDIALLEGLASCGALQIDAVLVTHPDDDHCGSLSALRGVVGVGEVLVAADLLETDNAHCAGLRASASALVGADRVIGLRSGDAIRVGHIGFTVVGPDRFSDGGGNADSLVLVMSCDADGDGIGDYTALFCGDAESAQINGYIAEGRIGDVDLYKVGHHGSAAAVDGRMLEVLKPEVSIVSVGEGNRYGHPVPDTLAQLKDAGSTVFRTDMQGAITCFLRRDGIHVQTAR